VTHNGSLLAEKSVCGRFNGSEPLVVRQAITCQRPVKFESEVTLVRNKRRVFRGIVIGAALPRLLRRKRHEALYQRREICLLRTPDSHGFIFHLDCQRPTA
jgi:hypothetical protein